jgi:acetylornithine deacetylase/succinyl-diaminopimelate desuccinylase-like protein
VVEGEEEISSINLPQWCENNRDLLRADGLLWEGGGYDEKGRHVIARGCKGIAYFELRVHGAKLDLHSSVAPIVGNPAWRLVHALSTLKNERDEITIDGYMDHVAAPTPELIAQIDALPSDDYAQQKARFGISQWLNGMDDLTAKRRLYLEPTVTICGIESGYTLKGSKTVLPAYAFAKVDCRLVPNLTPHIAQEAIRAHLDRRGFTDVEVVLLGGEEPADSISGSRIERASIAALQDVFGETPINQPRFAGSGPMHPLSTMLDIPVVSAGTTWHPDARVHSPNENIVEKDYLDGIRFTAALIHRFAAGE